MRLFFFLISLFFLLQFPLLTDDIPVGSSINSVTVYSDRAEVLRDETLRLKPGFHSIIFEKLPATLIPNSVRVYGTGTASVKLLGIEVEDQFYESPSLPEMKKLKKDIENLEYEIAKMRNEVEILNSQENFINSIQTKTAERAGQEISQGKPDPLSWDKAMSFFEKKLQEIKRSKLELEKKIDYVNQELIALRKKLDSITPSKALQGKRVTLSVEVSKEGDFRFNISYITRGPSWSPLYTLKALPDSEEVEFSISSKITQKSGEDWTNVKIFLSTSTPALAVSPPELKPWILDIIIPKQMKKAMEERESIARMDKVLIAEMPKPEASLEFSEAEIVETGLHLKFEIPRNVSVPSDGSPHKLYVSTGKLSANFDYITVPKLNESAFLRGKVKNSLQYPIIPGVADIFILQEYVGSTNLPLTSKDDVFSLFFGRDDQIKVKYDILKKEKGGAGLFGNRERIKFVYRITIQNLRRNSIVIEVLDQVPIPQNTQIEIKDVNLNPQPNKKNENGILSWILSLAPQEEKEIKIEFTVEYPKDANISGL
ncbi:MAG: mucoidy inhibitor MuiA family protein [Candidatus Aminicenantia bacterium]